jgi:uncharacterized protein (TIGR00730 family)
MKPNKPAICVFCGSAAGLDPAFSDAAARMGRLIGEAGAKLVFGGGGHGLMGDVAKSARKAGAEIVGIMPDFLRAYELPPSWERELILTPDMPQRKTQLMDVSDAFVVLPGGPGTIDEFFEVLVAASLGVLPKPIVVVSVNGYFAPLEALMAHMAENGFVREGVRDLYRMVPSPEDAMTAIMEALSGATEA